MDLRMEDQDCKPCHVEQAADALEVLGRCIMNMPPALRCADPSADIRAMRRAIEEVAKQALTSEMDEGTHEHADFEGAYNEMIVRARTVLKNG